MLYPFTPLVTLGVQDSATEWEVGGAAWPVPDTEMVVGELGVLLATFTLAPLNTSVFVGANVTFRVVD